MGWDQSVYNLFNKSEHCFGGADKGETKGSLKVARAAGGASSCSGAGQGDSGSRGEERYLREANTCCEYLTPLYKRKDLYQSIFADVSVVEPVRAPDRIENAIIQNATKVEKITESLLTV